MTGIQITVQNFNLVWILYRQFIWRLFAALNFQMTESSLMYHDVSSTLPPLTGSASYSLIPRLMETWFSFSSSHSSLTQNAAGLPILSHRYFNAYYIVPSVNGPERTTRILHPFLDNSGSQKDNKYRLPISVRIVRCPSSWRSFAYTLRICIPSLSHVYFAKKILDAWNLFISIDSVSKKIVSNPKVNEDVKMEPLIE